MKSITLGILTALFALSTPMWAADAAKKETATKVDEGTKAELEAAKKKLDEAKAEYEKVAEKAKGSRPEGDGKRPDLSTLAGLAEMYKTQLTLTEDQFKKVSALVTEGQKDIDKAVENIKAQGALGAAERAKDTPDLAAVKKIHLAMAEAQADVDITRIKFSLAVKGLLTPAQLPKFNEVKKKMEERAKPRGPGGPGGEGGGRPPKTKGE